MSDPISIFAATSNEQHHLTSLATGKSGPLKHDFSAYGHSLPALSSQFGATGSNQTGSFLSYDLSAETFQKGHDYWKNSPAIESVHQKILGVTTADEKNGGSLQTLSALPAPISLMSASDDTDNPDRPSPSAGIGGDGAGGVEAPPGGEDVPVTGHNPGGTFTPGSGTGSGSSSPDHNLPPDIPEEINTHGHRVKIIKGVAYLEANKGGLVTYQTPTGEWKSLKVGDLDNEISKAAQDIGDSAPTEQTIQNIYEYFSSDTHSINDVRSQYAHSDAIKAKVDQNYQEVLNRPSDPAGLQSQLDGLGSDQTLGSMRYKFAHSEEATRLYTDLIPEVQGRTPNDQDKNWVNAQKDQVSGTSTYKQVRHDLAHFEGEAWVIDPYWNDILGRSPTTDERNAVEDKLADNSTLTDMRHQLAHSDKTFDEIANEFQNRTGKTISNDAHTFINNIQGDLDDGSLKMGRVKELINAGTRLSTIDHNKAPNSYNSASGMPADAIQYKDGSGRTFMIKSTIKFSDVISDAKLHENENIISQIESLNNAVGHEGKFDVQRDKNSHILYTNLIDNANYNVGLWAAAAGLGRIEMIVLGGVYIAGTQTYNASFNYSDTYNRDVPLWEQGYDDYKNGSVK